MAEGSPAVVPLSIITTRPGPGTLWVYVAGEIDLATAGQLRGALLAVAAAEPPGARVRVDLERVTFIDAIGVGVLVRGHQAALGAGHELTVHNPRGIVKRVFDMLGVGELLGIPKT